LSRYELEIIGVKLPAHRDIKSSIRNRIDAMGEDNLIDEVREGLRRGYRNTRVMEDDVVYLPLVRYLDGIFTKEQAFEDMQIKWEKMHTRQMTDYSELKADIGWVESSMVAPIESREYLKRKETP
jgi:tRNA A37 N6-isopentenylltransferase MiaA